MFRQRWRCCSCSNSILPPLMQVVAAQQLLLLLADTLPPVQAVGLRSRGRSSSVITSVII